MVDPRVAPTVARHRRHSDDRRTDRRQFLRHSGAVLATLAAGAALVGGVGRRLGGRFTAAQSRAAVVLPTAAERLAGARP